MNFHFIFIQKRRRHFWIYGMAHTPITTTTLGGKNKEAKMLLYMFRNSWMKKFYAWISFKVSLVNLQSAHSQEELPKNDRKPSIAHCGNCRNLFSQFVAKIQLNFTIFFFKWAWISSLSISTQCGNYENLLPHIFGKNFVKVIVLLKKSLNSWFDEIFFSERKFFIFQHCGHQAWTISTLAKYDFWSTLWFQNQNVLVLVRGKS